MSGSDREVCVALDSATGQPLWTAVIDTARYDAGGDSGDGPRSTPVYYRNRLYVLSSRLKLACLDAATGATVWNKDLTALYGGRVIPWQNSASPVIEEGRIFLNANGSPQTCLALSAEDGSLLWKATSYATTHATPVLATILGVRQVVFLTQYGLVALSPDQGRELWRYKFPYNTSTGASPVVYDDMVYCSAAYNVGAAVVRIGKAGEQFTVTELWRRPRELMNHWGTPVCHQGYLYGLYGNGAYYTAPLKCVEMATGNEMWSQPDFGLGGLILADGKLLVLSENGELVMVDTDPRAYTELARFQALEDKCWNIPVLSNGRLYARSIQEGACFELFAPVLPKLRWISWERPAPDRFQWLVGTDDATPADATRLGNLRVLRSPVLSPNAGDWSAYSVQMTLTNGLICLEGEIEPNAGSSFFKVIEER